MQPLVSWGQIISGDSLLVTDRQTDNCNFSIMMSLHSRICVPTFTDISGTRQGHVQREASGARAPTLALAQQPAQ
jgi:hypothetical protein